MRPLQFLSALVMLLGACDLTLMIPVDLGKAACDILNPNTNTSHEDTQCLDVPRLTGERCDPEAVCEEDLLCACGICIDPDEVL